MKAILIGITLSGALIALVFARLCFGCLKKKRRFAALRHGFFGLLFTCVAALFGLVQVSTLGYRALVHETKVARLEIKPRAAAQQFEATIYVDDQPPQVFLLAGDEVYVDAHILKWKSWANLIGMHTMYELDRIGGRYRNLNDEFEKPRTLYHLSQKKPVNAFIVRQRYASLAPVVDAQYGSASFVPAEKTVTYDLMLSTSGLLMREAP
ncbi:MAG: hypothetical protein KDC35_02910 [Acidobacteria bacterium]|nr:hypothetical protein [Acidobacteriota bacterium]